MTILLDLVYFVGLFFALPFLVVKSVRTKKYRAGWAGRFGMGEAVLLRRNGEGGERARVLLLHCVSVGELLSVQTLVSRLLAADARLHVVISTGTDTGTARAKALYPAVGGESAQRVHTVRFPVDLSFAVEAFFDRVRPDAIALVELETWPNFLAIARRRGIPVVIINGRISDKSFPRYRWIRPVMKGMLRQVAWIGAQTQGIAERFVALGAERRKVTVVPTLKYDNAPMDEAVGGKEALAAAMGLAGEQELFVAGSTGPGEEEAILSAYETLRREHPQLRLAIVPRHPEVVPQVIAAIKGRGLVPVLRSERPDPEAKNGNSETGSRLAATEVFVLNTMGELRKLYALAMCVFVGRSLVKLGGSDMIEVAALGKPCCFGPYTANFAEVVELLLARGTAVRVRDAVELTQALKGWLEDPATAREMGERARRVVIEQRGSTDIYVRQLRDLLADRSRTGCLSDEFGIK